jgi:integral membrane sensor domain MASE1
MWPAVAVAALLANFTTSNKTVFTATGIVFGNTLEAVVGARLLTRIVGFQPSLLRFKDVLGLIGLAASLSTMVSATIGVTCLCLGGVQPWSNFTSLWWIWWLGDAIGDLVVAPVILVWSLRRTITWRPMQFVEAAALLAAIVLTSLFVLTGVWIEVSFYPLKYTLFPLVIWAALRFGQEGATMVNLLASSIANWAVARGLGATDESQSDAHLAVLQSFIGVTAASGLLVAAAMGERNTSERQRAASHAATKILAESNALSEAAPRIVEAVCESLGWDMGAVWSVDADADVLRCADVWHRPGLRVARFEAITRERTFEKGVGLPGRVWASGAPAWIPDVVQDKNFPRAPVAGHVGLHGAFGFPIRLHDQTLGGIEFFSREIRQPDEPLLKLMTTIGTQIRQFVDRTRGEAALRTARAQLQITTDTMAAGVSRCSRDGRYLWVSGGYTKWLGRRSTRSSVVRFRTIWATTRLTVCVRTSTECSRESGWSSRWKWISAGWADAGSTRPTFPPTLPPTCRTVGSRCSPTSPDANRRSRLCAIPRSAAAPS